MYKCRVALPSSLRRRRSQKRHIVKTDLPRGVPGRTHDGVIKASYSMTQFLVRPKASRRRKQFVLPMVLFLAVAAEEKTQAKAKSATGLTCYATLRACLGIPPQHNLEYR